MIVMKFGGTSVKDIEAVNRVSGIVSSRKEQKPAIVVSAVGGSTDDFVAILDLIEEGKKDEAKAIAQKLADLHDGLVDETVTKAELQVEVRKVFAEKFDLLDHLIDGMACLGEVSLRSRDAVLSLGEQMSAPLLASCLAARGLPAVAVDPKSFMITDETFGFAVPDRKVTDEKCRETVGKLIESGKIPVVGGFVGATPKGVVTTLGRGGSDLTAAIIAGALGAESLQFWKDVDGLLTTDPRIVSDAKLVEHATFKEAAELAFLGAQVLHPASIQPAVDAHVPVRVLNSYKPDTGGTLIRLATDMEKKRENPVTSIAFKRNQVLVNVFSTRMLGATGFLRKVFEVFDNMNLSVDHIATSEVNVTVTLGQTDKIEELCQKLGEVAEVTIQENIGILSVVGEDLVSSSGVAAKAFSALKDFNVKFITYGGSGVNLSMVVENDQVDDAVKKLHSSLF